MAITGLALIAGSVGVLLSRGATAGPAGQPQVFSFRYTAKFVCGDVTAGSSKAVRHALKQAGYFTAINVHNPTEDQITLQKKVVQALPEDETPLPPTNFQTQIEIGRAHV